MKNLNFEKFTNIIEKDQEIKNHLFELKKFQEKRICIENIKNEYLQKEIKLVREQLNEKSIIESSSTNKFSTISKQNEISSVIQEEYELRDRLLKSDLYEELKESKRRSVKNQNNNEIKERKSLELSENIDFRKQNIINDYYSKVFEVGMKNDLYSEIKNNEKDKAYTNYLKVLKEKKKNLEKKSIFLN